MTQLDWNVIDHADEVLEYLGRTTDGLSYQDRTEMGQTLLRMAAKRLTVGLSVKMVHKNDEDDPVQGIQYLDVIRVEQEDDGSFTAVVRTPR